MVDEREFLDEEERGLGDIIAAFRRHKLLALLMALGVFVAGTVIIFLLPTYYESTATILLEEPEVPEELVQPGADHREIRSVRGQAAVYAGLVADRRGAVKYFAGPRERRIE
jgi:uncharacterized protein involved in exopolysaccharide biosynthesis